MTDETAKADAQQGMDPMPPLDADEGLLDEEPEPDSLPDGDAEEDEEAEQG